ncbi:MAG: hypothetical protein M1832_002049 [Thelocarpon impressellum]|nr:MAG: hypothetical protein M1832_002049 [Thelocarpon impressellum]
MSFISSVIADITGDGHLPQKSVAARAPSEPAASTPVSGHGVASAGLKRKAEEEMQRILGKAQKMTGSAATGTSRPAGKVPGKPTVKAPATGKAKPAPPPAATIPKVPPRKGTYAEIMARAKAAQATPVQVGAIKHKPMEKISQRERRAERERDRGKPTGILKRSLGGTAAKVAKKPMTPSKERDVSGKSGRMSGESGSGYKGTAHSSYKGTARSAKPEATYKGTARLSSADRSSKKGGPTVSSSARRDNRIGSEESRDRSRSSSVGPAPPRHRHDSYSDEEEYESDASSVMEAAAFEVEEEEQLALKSAQKEDAQALREEEEHQRRKRERKLKLLASKRK